MTELLKIPQVMERLQISRRLAYELVAQGKLPHYRIGEGSLRVSEDQHEAFISEHLAPGYTRSDSGDTPKE